jgi:hypothetical protein
MPRVAPQGGERERGGGGGGRRRRRRRRFKEEKGEKGEGEGGRRSPYRGAAGGFFASCSVFITTPCGLHWQLQYRTK